MHFKGMTMKFTKVNTKLCKFSGLQQSQNALNTGVLGQQLQPFVTATRTTLIHNIFAQRYLAVKSCVMLT